MPEIRGITIAVGAPYAFTLGICLPRNMRHFSECTVVTTPDDHAVKAVASKVPGVRVVETDEFFAHGAKFNKGLAMERGFSEMGRHGWIWIWDADCLFPDFVPFERLQFGKLHGCRRRILQDPRRWHTGLPWSACPPCRNEGPIGFTQIFHADDPVVKDRQPWYDVSFGHAGGGDAAFLRHWTGDKHVALPMDVLHLGPRDTNWFGTDEASRQLMSEFVVRNRWTKRRPELNGKHPDESVSIPHRVHVPGYGISDFELPFVRHRQQAEQTSITTAP